MASTNTIDSGVNQAAPVARGPKGRRPKFWLWGILGFFVVLIAAILLFLAFANWNMLRGPIGRFASAQTGRTIVLHGDLSVHPFSWSPSATVRGITISRPGWQGQGDMAKIDQMDVSVRLLPLLHGELVLPNLVLVHPQLDLLSDKDNRQNWVFNKADPNKAGNLPLIQNLAINNGQLHFVDQKRRLTISGAIQASQVNIPGAGTGGFQMTGEGALNGNKFTIQIGGGPLINVRRDRPYPFSGHIASGATKVSLTGNTPHPFDLRQLSIDLTAQGQDLRDLYDVSGLVLPNTPPYQLRAHLVRNNNFYQFSSINGRIGSSDLEGMFSVQTGLASHRPLMKADLRSRQLYMIDLSTLFGGRSKAVVANGGAPALTLASAGPGTTAPVIRRLLPDATLDAQRLRTMDATLNYRADSLVAGNLPLRQASLRLSLDDGVLLADPVQFDFPQGRLTANIKLDGRGAVPSVDVDARLTNVDLAPFLAKTKAPDAFDGVLSARARLHGDGRSVHEAADHANGDVALVIPHGQVRRAFAELAGVDLAKGLGLMLTKNQSTTNLRCGVADFSANQGVLNVRQMVLDTDVVSAKGSGTINMSDESLHLKLQGTPKKFQLVHLNAPIELGGHLSAPKVGVSTTGVIAQAGVAGGLGLLAGPLAVILPFIDPGLAKDADCTALIAQSAHQDGTPKKLVAQTTKAPPHLH